MFSLVVGIVLASCTVMVLLVQCILIVDHAPRDHAEREGRRVVSVAAGNRPTLKAPRLKHETPAVLRRIQGEMLLPNRRVSAAGEAGRIRPGTHPEPQAATTASDALAPRLRTRCATAQPLVKARRPEARVDTLFANHMASRAYWCARNYALGALLNAMNAETFRQVWQIPLGLVAKS